VSLWIHAHAVSVTTRVPYFMLDCIFFWRRGLCCLNITNSEWYNYFICGHWFSGILILLIGCSLHFRNFS
jgi:hypothetical protein